MPEGGFRRHDLLRITSNVWQAILASREVVDPLLANWIRQGRPVMVRRRTPAELGGDPAIAVALPPASSCRRFAAVVEPVGIVDARRPALLAEALKAAPTAWQMPLRVLSEIGDDCGVPTRVFGSLLWQHETGLPYLTASSDLDLLWDVDRGSDLFGLLDRLQREAPRLPMRLDGEIVFPGDRAVQWRELARGDGRVLVKTSMAVLDCSRSELLEGLSQPAGLIGRRCSTCEATA